MLVGKVGTHGSQTACMGDTLSMLYVTGNISQDSLTVGKYPFLNI